MQLRLGTRMRYLPLFLIILSLGTTASANIMWSFTATFGAAVGPDTEMLAGAVITATYEAPLPANYASLFGTPIAPVNLAATSYTISGSGNAANNATFGPTLLFGGTLLGLAPDFFSGGSAAVGTDGVEAITLPSGNTLQLGGPSIASIASPLVGSPVSMAHFPTGLGNAMSFAPGATVPSGFTETYAPSAPTWSFVTTPEPGTLALLGIGLTGLASFGRRRVARTTPAKTRNC